MIEGSGYAWILNSAAIKNLGEIGQFSHAYQESDSLGFLKQVWSGFFN